MKQHLNEIQDTLLELNSLKNDIEFITDPNSEYFELVILDSVFFKTTFQRATKLFIIDLCKLLNSKEQYSIKRLVDRVETAQTIITPQEIEFVKNSLSTMEVKYLRQLKSLRDKFYVHNDKDKDDSLISIKFDELWFILSELNQIYDILNKKLLNRKLFKSGFSNVASEIILLKRYYLMEKYVNNTSNPTELDYRKLKDILSNK